VGGEGADEVVEHDDARVALGATLGSVEGGEKACEGVVDTGPVGGFVREQVRVVEELATQPSREVGEDVRVHVEVSLVRRSGGAAASASSRVASPDAPRSRERGER
jgi:hypothetical protein